MLVIILPNPALIVFSCPSLGEIHDLVPVQYHVAAPDEKRFSKVLGGQNILAPENGLDSGQKFPWVKRLGQLSYKGYEFH